VLGMNLRWMWR